jgi:hypothetical protein
VRKIAAIQEMGGGDWQSDRIQRLFQQKSLAAQKG